MGEKRDVSEMMNTDRITLGELETLITHALYYFKFNFTCFMKEGGEMMRQRNHNLINTVTLLTIPEKIYSLSVPVSLFLSYDINILPC